MGCTNLGLLWATSKSTSMSSIGGVYDLGNSSNIDLSEEFLIFILQQVDDLCENIKNGDADTQRTFEINKKLNDAVVSYRNKLEAKKQMLVKLEPLQDNEYFENVDDTENNDVEPKLEADEEFDPAVQKGTVKKKMGRPIASDLNEKFEYVKNQCGSHSTTAMCVMLGMSKGPIISR